MKKKFILVLFIFFSFSFISRISYSLELSHSDRVNYNWYDENHSIVKGKYNDEEKLRKLVADYNIALEEGNTEKANKLKRDIDYIADDIGKLYRGVYSLNGLYIKLRDFFTYTGRNLVAVCVYLLGILSILEVLMILIEKPAEMPIGKIGWVLLKYGILRFFISFWLYFTIPFMGAAARLAAIAANATGVVLINPTDIWHFYSEPVIVSYQSLSFWSTLGIGYIVWAIILFPALCLAGLIAIDYFMADLEYRLLTGFSIVLLPFIAFKHTTSIGVKVFTVLSSQIVRIMFMYFFTAIGTSVIPSIKPFNFYSLGNEGMRLLFDYTIVLYAMRILVGKVPALASALMTGAGGVMNSRDVSGAIGSAVAKVIGITTMAIAGSNYLKNRASKIAGKMRDAANLNRKNR